MVAKGRHRANCCTKLDSLMLPILFGNSYSSYFSHFLANWIVLSNIDRMLPVTLIVLDHCKSHLSDSFYNFCHLISIENILGGHIQLSKSQRPMSFSSFPTRVVFEYLLKWKYPQGWAESFSWQMFWRLEGEVGTLLVRANQLAAQFQDFADFV